MQALSSRRFQHRLHRVNLHSLTVGGSAAPAPGAHGRGARPREDAANGWYAGDCREEAAARDAPVVSGGRSDEEAPPLPWQEGHREQALKPIFGV